VVFVARGQHEIVAATGTKGVAVVSVALALACLVCAGVAIWASNAGLGERLRMSPQNGRRLAIAGVVAAVIAAVVFAAAFGGRAYDQFNGKDVTTASRFSDQRLAGLNGNRHNLWASGWAAFKARPLQGTGPGTFEFWWSRNGTNGEFVRDAHNIYLEALAEQGVIGLLLLVAFFAGLLVAALRARSKLRSDSGVGVHAGLVAVFCVFALQAGVDWMWESTAVAVLALAAIACASAAGGKRSNAHRSLSASLGLIVAAVLSVVVLLPGLLSGIQINQSQAAYRAHDEAAALRDAQRAVDAEPWSASAYGQLAVARESAGDLAGASAAIAAAQRKEPTNWRWPLVALRIYVARGDAPAAQVQLKKAKQLRKYSPLFGRKGPAIR
jgi:tetratricopeptide (TPR) repeat protein